MSFSRLAPLVLLVPSLSLGLAVSGCSRSPEPTTRSVSPAAGNAAAPGEAAMRAVIDPETGRLEVRATPGRLALDPETRESLRRDSEGLVEIHHPNGAVEVDLQGRFHSVAVARIGKDGKVAVCTEDMDATETSLNTPPASGTTLEVQ